MRYIMSMEERYYEIPDFDEEIAINAIYEAVKGLIDYGALVTVPRVSLASGLSPEEVYERLHIVCTIQERIEQERNDRYSVN